MSYVQNGKIEYGDVNKFATGSTTGTVPDPALVNINSLWGTGFGSVGYGQLGSVSTVAQNNTVLATDWSSLTSTMNNIIRHQSGTLSPVFSSPAKNERITYNQNITKALQSLWDTRLNSYSLGRATDYTTVSRTVTNGWTSSINVNFAVTFATGNNARYFFNSGGMIKISFSQSNYSTSSVQANTTNTLCAQTGDLYIAAPSGTDTAQVASLNKVFNGFTQITAGSIATRTIYDTSGGYYGLTTTSKPLYKINSATYPGTYLSVNANTNGVQGVKGDNGSVVTINAKWVASPASTTNITGSFTTTCTVMYPSTAYLANSWGTATITVV